MSHQILPSFSAADFEHDFVIKKVELGKMAKILQRSWITKANYELFLEILRDYFKTSLQHMFEWDCITYKVLKVSTFVSANKIIFATLFLNRDASLVV